MATPNFEQMFANLKHQQSINEWHKLSEIFPGVYPIKRMYRKYKYGQFGMYWQLILAAEGDSEIKIVSNEWMNRVLTRLPYSPDILLAEITSPPTYLGTLYVQREPTFALDMNFTRKSLATMFGWHTFYQEEQAAQQAQTIDDAVAELLDIDVVDQSIPYSITAAVPKKKGKSEKKAKATAPKKKSSTF